MKPQFHFVYLELWRVNAVLWVSVEFPPLLLMGAALRPHGIHSPASTRRLHMRKRRGGCGVYTEAISSEPFYAVHLLIFPSHTFSFRNCDTTMNKACPLLWE